MSKSEGLNIKRNKRLPFYKEEHYGDLIDVSKISIDDLNALLDEGFRDIEEGKFQTAEEAFKNIFD